MTSPTLRRPRASLVSLGCRVNQYEIRETAADLVRLGYDLVPAGKPADVHVINTCAVTAEAVAKSRGAIRRAHRSGDDPLIVATGCYSELAREEVLAMPGVASVAPNADKPRLAELVDETVRRSGRLLFPLDEGSAEPIPGDALLQVLRETGGAVGRTRAVIKIQDGCNHFCSFCIIPFARGRLRSRPAAEILQEARGLVEQGYRELVLTGICIGDFGDERGASAADGDPLARLIQQLAALPGLERIRLSSLDPADVTDDLLDTVAALPQACRHFHLSLQSGSSDVLRRMRRRYDAEQFLQLVQGIYGRMPDAGLTCDVIVGFPGETEADFQETSRVCRFARFSHIHCFPYSPRPGTLAARWADDVPLPEKRARSASLIEQSERQRDDFLRGLVGQVVSVIAETYDEESGRLSGLTGSYARVHFPGGPEQRGATCAVRVRSVEGGVASGEQERSKV